MEVILLEKVNNLGNLGDKVNVKAGYGRNCLIPQNKAVFATPKNIEHFEQRRAELEQKAQQSLARAEQKAAKINDITVEIQTLASDEGKLYGSVGVSEIKDALSARGIEIDKRDVRLPEGRAIHSIGEYTIEIQLHSDVVASLQVHIASNR